ncbi:MAG TPA: BON domain-containing protein [Thermoanaerobaculia bacterium]|jgi:hypothetical protein|nr:BON domain-containing protein [Thermoanaerobaculia bacterium]
MPTRDEDFDSPHYGEPSRRDYGRGSDAGYRGGGYLGGDWAGGRRYLDPYRGQSGPMWGPPDRDFVPRDDNESPPVSYRGVGPRNYRRSDERIRDDVCDLLMIDGAVDASEIDVSVNDSVVVLSGAVADRMTKRRAEAIAESVLGVKDVQNNLRLSA